MKSHALYLPSLAIAALVAGHAAGAPSGVGEETAQGANQDLRGTAGVCVRWDSATHVADAVVVVSSGNPTLDRALPDTIRSMAWPAPDPPYHGEWVGITMAVAGAPANMPLPSCASLPTSPSKPR